MIYSPLSPKHTHFESSLLSTNKLSLPQVATDMSEFLNKGSYFRRKDTHKPLSNSWFHKFIKRWPALQIGKPRSLSMARAKATTPTIISAYYDQLKSIMDEHDFINKPGQVYNLDESGFNSEHKSPTAVGSSAQCLQDAVLHLPVRQLLHLLRV